MPTSGPLIAVSLGNNHVDNPEIEKWYGSHSVVFAAHDHPVWTSERDQKRIRRKGKWGDVRRCDPTEQPGIGGQMEWAFKKALKWVETETVDERVVDGESVENQK